MSVLVQEPPDGHKGFGIFRDMQEKKFPTFSRACVNKSINGECEGCNEQQQLKGLETFLPPLPASPRQLAKKRWRKKLRQ